MNFETTIPGLPVERRENRKADPLDADRAKIEMLILNYGAQCAAYHFGSQVTEAYQAVMDELARQADVR